MTESRNQRRRRRSWRDAFVPFLILCPTTETSAAFVGCYYPQTVGKQQRKCGTQNRSSCAPAIWGYQHAEQDADPPTANTIKTRQQPPPPSSSQPTRITKRPRQSRSQPSHRRPRYYWFDPHNLRQGLYDFWSEDCGVTDVDRTRPPTIPNEVLLYHYQRHDLRAAIARNGGRERVARMLGGAPVMPGRWRDAVRSRAPELQQLLRKMAQQQAVVEDGDDNSNNDNNTTAAFSLQRPPRVVTSNAVVARERKNEKPWSHQATRKPKGYWSSLQIVVRELYEYVDWYKEQHDRPSVWMPRPSELAAHGRDDLRQAINRFGGIGKVCRAAGMVSHREWYYFEGQLELLLDLKAYLDQNCHGDYRSFPTVASIQRNGGYDQLQALIQYFGGRKFLAARLGMNAHYTIRTNKAAANATSTTAQERSDSSSSGDTPMMFGSFDLDFAVRLLQFVRRDHLRRSPPLQYPVLGMPSRAKLLAIGEEGAWLDAKIDEFGGYENVARRLGLALFASESWSGRLR